MKNFKEFITEALDDMKIYKTKESLWIAYAEGSGTSFPMTKGYITDKKGDDNYEPDVMRSILRATKSMKPSTKKGSVKMFEMPIYDVYDNLSVWGGSNKPKKMGAFIVSEGNPNVVTFFDTKKEAQAWMRATV